MKVKDLRDLVHVCLLVLVPGLLAWLCGRPLIFPSLGPSALAIVLDEKGNRARQVIGGHLVGVLSGLIAYHLLARGLSLAALTPELSMDGLRIVASGVVSVGLASLAMLTTRTTHAPACATTLIVSLGVLPSLLDGTLIMVAVVLLFLSYRLLRLVWKSDTTSL
ncbi:MAG: HPP family protein [Limisphaerales bacterium]